MYRHVCGGALHREVSQLSGVGGDDSMVNGEFSDIVPLRFTFAHKGEGKGRWWTF